MDIQQMGNEVVIRLSTDEAASVQFDHGEMALIIPVEDTVETMMRFNAAFGDATRREQLYLAEIHARENGDESQ